MSPLEVLRKAVSKISIDRGRRFANKPGAVIESMSDKDREALKDLKSCDIDGSPSNDKIENLEYHTCFEYHFENKEFKKELIAFEGKLKK